MKSDRTFAIFFSRTFPLLFLLFYKSSSINAQYIEINYYDPVMRIVSLPDYLINIQTDNAHKIIIRDSVLITFIRERIDDLVESDSIPQSYNSDVQLVYVFPNGNFDVLTFSLSNKYSTSACKNGRMYHKDIILYRIIKDIIDDPRKNTRTGEIRMGLINYIKGKYKIF